MKRNVPPAALAVAALVLLGVIALFFWRSGGAAGPNAPAAPGGMPPEVTAEFQKRLGGAPGAAPGQIPAPPGAR